MYDYTGRINELNEFCDDKNEHTLSLQSIDSFYKLASEYDRILGQAELDATHYGTLYATWQINKRIKIIEIECHIKDYQVLVFYNDTRVPDIFNFNLQELRNYLNEVIKNNFHMRTNFSIYNVPGNEIIFYTEAHLSIGKYAHNGFAMGFKIHISSITINSDKDTGQYVIDAIHNEGWYPLFYEHILYDEAFVTIKHANDELMRILPKRT